MPVLLIGTYKAFPLFTKEFALARRTTGQGSVVIGNMANDKCWDYFLNSIWGYQWTNVNTPLTHALSRAFYDESQGIVDIAVKLYMFAQLQVIGSDDEAITPALVSEVAKENLHAVRPMLRAIKNHDIAILAYSVDADR